MGDDRTEDAARHPPLQGHHGAEQCRRQHEKGDACDSRDNGIHDRRDENGMPATDCCEERTAIEELLGHSVEGRDDRDDGERPEACVIEQAVNRPS